MAGTAGEGDHGTGAFAGARTPEDLETLFEDAFVIRDRAALAGLFEEGAVLVADDGQVASGSTAIARLVTALWERDHTYIADPRRVVQARDIALVVAERAINVMRRGRDGAWRYVMALQSSDALTASGVEMKEHHPREGGDRS
jgi:ketosteroid isomerase-like protein